MNSNANILVVDDEPDNCLILENFLGEAGYQTQIVYNGEEALDVLSDEPDHFSLVLLDWMMPGMNGLEVLKNMQVQPELKNMQVVMQTARARSDEIQQGINAGAWYYLTKPFEEHEMLAIVKTALLDKEKHLKVLQNMQRADPVKPAGNRFVIRSIEEARNLAALLARLCPNPSVQVIGLTELLLNAIEHGNLDIDYDMKTNLMAEGMWEEEVSRRLSLPEYATRSVVVHMEHVGELEMHFTIEDEGNGFDWKKYQEFCPSRVTHYHGRGIAMSKMLSFNSLEYFGKGNKVLAVVQLNKE